MAPPPVRRRLGDAKALVSQKAHPAPFEEPIRSVGAPFSPNAKTNETAQKTPKARGQRLARRNLSW
eukprot:7507186-Pyramimonas_sp.AAC.1